MQSESRKTVLAALAANLAIAIAKAAAGLIGHSAAMLAEAAHSVADTMNQVFLLVSLSLGDREPDEAHPFGYGKERELLREVISRHPEVEVVLEQRVEPG